MDYQHWSVDDVTLVSVATLVLVSRGNALLPFPLCNGCQTPLLHLWKVREVRGQSKEVVETLFGKQVFRSTVFHSFSVSYLNSYCWAKAEGRLWGNISKLLQVAIYDLPNERVISTHITLIHKQLVNLNRHWLGCYSSFVAKSKVFHKVSCFSVMSSSLSDISSSLPLAVSLPEGLFVLLTLSTSLYYCYILSYVIISYSLSVPFLLFLCFLFST